MKRRRFFRALLAAPLAMAAFVREPDKMIEQDFDEFLELAMRPGVSKKYLVLSENSILRDYDLGVEILTPK